MQPVKQAVLKTERRSNKKNPCFFTLVVDSISTWWIHGDTATVSDPSATCHYCYYCYYC
jgi:hypothetical protein